MEGSQKIKLIFKANQNEVEKEEEVQQIYLSKQEAKIEREDQAEGGHKMFKILGIEVEEVELIN